MCAAYLSVKPRYASQSYPALPLMAARSKLNIGYASQSDASPRYAMVAASTWQDGFAAPLPAGADSVTRRERSIETLP